MRGSEGLPHCDKTSEATMTDRAVAQYNPKVPVWSRTYVKGIAVKVVIYNRERRSSAG